MVTMTDKMNNIDVNVIHFEYLAMVRHDGSEPNTQEYIQTLKDLCNWLEDKSVLVVGADDFPLGLLSGRWLAKIPFDKDGCTITRPDVIHKFDVVQTTRDGKTFRYLKYVGDSHAQLREYSNFTPIEKLGITVGKPKRNAA